MEQGAYITYYVSRWTAMGLFYTKCVIRLGHHLLLVEIAHKPLEVGSKLVDGRINLETGFHRFSYVRRGVL